DADPVVERARHRARTEGENKDAGPRHLARQRLAERQNEALRRTIDGGVRNWQERRDRGEVDYGAPLARHHVLHEDMRQPDQGADIDVDLWFLLGKIVRQEIAAEAEAGVVDQEVDAQAQLRRSACRRSGAPRSARSASMTVAWMECSRLSLF